ncbi:MAG: hypothetical protein ABR572_00775 [Cryomorphaceae bacterium]|nr:hypothetical protein [Flavobacteriales bacterium]
MQKSTLISLMETQKFPDENTLEQVRELSNTYPWCSAFKVLQAVGAKQFDRLDAKDYLNTASVYIGDRTKLYSYTVRKKLLEHIAVSEETDIAEVKQDEPTGAEQEVAPPLSEPIGKADSDQNRSLLQEEDVTEKINSPISSDPLEAQILSAAVGQLGEMEVEVMLSQKDEQPGSTEKADAEPSVGKKVEAAQNLSSFASWLNSLDGDTSTTVKKSSPPADDILEKFISDSPQITPAKASFFSPSQMGKMSLVEDESFVTETLARIYEKQHDFKKAARAYARLGLKYPEKSVYFAALQKQAEEKIKS